MANNKWSPPESPPPPLFLGQKEKDLVKQVNDELLERVIGQLVIYYPIDYDTTNFHPIYGEALIKNFLPPIRVYALVEWSSYQSKMQEAFGLDKVSEITVHFHKRRLTEDQNLFVREGDFIRYDGVFYEIMTLSEPKQIFGQVEDDRNSTEILAKCVKSRKGVFDAT
jgi:hypothetical protein